MTRPSAGPEKAQGAISIVEHTPIVSLNSEGTGASDGGPDAQRVPLAKAAREAQKMRSASALLNDWKLSPQDLSYGVLHIDTQHPVYELHALPESLPCSVRR